MQPLTLEPLAGDPFAVLRASGELDLHTQDEFEQAVRRLLDTSPVVVDLSGIDFLAISALQSLLVCHRLAASMGRVLFFAEPSPQTLRLLTVSGLDTVLPVAPTVADVVTRASGGTLDAGRDRGAGKLVAG
jgi:anti-anti-sigma factor